MESMDEAKRILQFPSSEPRIGPRSPERGGGEGSLPLQSGEESKGSRSIAAREGARSSEPLLLRRIIIEEKSKIGRVGKIVCSKKKVLGTIASSGGAVASERVRNLAMVS